MTFRSSPASDSPISPSARSGKNAGGGPKSSHGTCESFFDAVEEQVAEPSVQHAANSASTASTGIASPSTLHLLLASAVVAPIWLLLLPALLHLAPIRSHVDHLNARGVDASAMYYTELEPEWLIDHRSTEKTE
jgi:hypothetical protein